MKYNIHVTQAAERDMANAYDLPFSKAAKPQTWP